MEDAFSYMSGREGNRISRGFALRRNDDSASTEVSDKDILIGYSGSLPVGRINRVRYTPDLELED